jgi:hypothetical protein
MSLGFIILRCVRSKDCKDYWIECYDAIRRFYPLNKILIIDDFSNYEFIDTNKILINTLIIQSEFKGRGELLPYYYYLNNKLFDRAVILHDSVFINQYIDFGEENQILWSFEHHWDHLYDYTEIINNLGQYKELIVDRFKNNTLWKGCFGVMSILTHDFLCQINNICNISNLLDVVTTREVRMAIERIFGVLFSLCNSIYNKQTIALFGDIHNYSHANGGFGAELFTTYCEKKENNSINVPITKIWTGR